MEKRLIGVVYLIPLLLVFLIGGWAFQLTMLILSICGIKELCDSFSTKNINPPIWISVLFGACYCILQSFDMTAYWADVATIIAFVAAVLMIMKKITATDIAVLVFAELYVFIPFVELTNIHACQKHGPAFVALIFVIAFSTDIFAYLIGRCFGKHKLIPSVSPNKTIEGAVGGIFGSIVITALYCYAFDLNISGMIIVAALGSVVAQLGDLFASSIKRYNQIKDFSTIIPGHGGMLDRFDSVIFVTLFIKLIINYIV